MKRLLLTVCALAAFSTAPALAHHSFAMFAMDKETVITGVVTEFQWTNPHTWIEINAVDGAGGAKHWSIEGGPVAVLSRQGWKRTTVKPGDQISMVIHPLRNGDPGGSLMGLVTADGRALGAPLSSPSKK